MSGVIKTRTGHNILRQWGLWSNERALAIGYSSPMKDIIEDNIEQNRTAREPVIITDDQACAIDAAVCLFAQTNHFAAKVLWLHYVRGKKFIYMTDDIGGSRQMVSNLHDQGVMWIEGYFANCEKIMRVA